MNIGRNAYIDIFFWSFVVLLFASVLLSKDIVIFLKEFIDGNNVISVFFFIFTMFIAVVIAPIAVLPIVPIVSPFFGPLMTTLYVVVGWSAGAVVAFLLARHIGRPTLSKVISLKTIEQYESRLPTNFTFSGLIFLRMIIPVDILSYIVGFVSSISVSKYTLATLIGITPFALFFSYGGVEFAQGNYKGLLILVLLAVSVFMLAMYFFFKGTKSCTNVQEENTDGIE